jgi:hypothetical protein
MLLRFGPAESQLVCQIVPTRCADLTISAVAITTGAANLVFLHADAAASPPRPVGFFAFRLGGILVT